MVGQALLAVGNLEQMSNSHDAYIIHLEGRRT